MGKFFSDPVEQALQYIYYHEDSGKGKEGLQLLEEASAAGDGDATCLLARCYCGYQYVWSGHGFPEDDKRASQLMRRSVEQGSALGVFLALRSGELTPSLEKKMPFESLKAAYDVVLEKAEGGEPFCQYVIGNCYFWWDFLRIENKGKDSFPSQAAFRAYLQENIVRCEDWYRKSYRGGLRFAGNNLYNYYTKGDEDLVPPQPEKAKGLFRIGAEWGNPLHQYFWAEELEEEGEKKEALTWYERSAEGGKLDAWFPVGKAYELGEVVPKDCAYAAQCYQKGLADEGSRVGCSNRLGALYFDGEGVERDYAKAYQLLKYAYDQDTTWGVCYLGKCCFYGLGTQQDYAAARNYLEQVDWTNREAFYILGYLYGRGLGGAEDIPKAVEYLQKAGDRKDAKEELLHYKKTLFGKWVRR